MSVGGIVVIALMTLVWTAFRTADGNERQLARYCLTIAVDLRADRGEEVGALDLVIENASVVSIPKFPVGWEMTVQNYVDNTPTKVSGGATGSVAELRAGDLRCLFEIESDVPGAPPIKVSGSAVINARGQERRVFLSNRQINLENIRAK